MERKGKKCCPVELSPRPSIGVPRIFASIEGDLDDPISALGDRRVKAMMLARAGSDAVANVVRRDDSVERRGQSSFDWALAIYFCRSSTDRRRSYPMISSKRQVRPALCKPVQSLLTHGVLVTPGALTL